jgi:hypothetical protein
MRRALLSVLVSVLAACGGSDNGDARPTGPIGATGPSAVTPVDSLSFGAEGVCVSGTSSVGISFVAVASADVANLCTLTTAGQSKAGMRAITLTIVRGALNTPPGVPPGKYAITTDPTGTTVVTLAAAAVSLSDATCASTSVDATGGNVWLDAVGAGRVAGAVDATLADGTRLSGTFDAPACAGIAPPIAELCAGTWVPPTGTCVP